MTKGWAISLALFAAAGSLTANPREKVTAPATVRHIDLLDAPEAKALARRARQIGDAVYPQIVKLFDTGGPQPPAQFDIVFRRHLSLPQVRDGGEPFGYACRGTVFLNASLLCPKPDDFEAVLVHEMTHVAQDYPHMACRHAWQYYGHYVGFKLAHPFRGYPSQPPSYWVEGLADYVCAKLGHTNSMDCPQCNESFPHYQSGYSCASAFLLYIDDTYGTEVIRQLNAALRRGVYAEDFFATATGKPLPALWEDFQKTKAFKPIAGDFNTLHEALNVASHPTAREMPALINNYFARNPEAKRFFAAFPMLSGLTPEQVQSEIESFLYTRRQPWGPAAAAAAEAAAGELDEALGRPGNPPPKDLRARVNQFFERHPDLKEYAAAHDWIKGDLPPDFRRAVKNFLLTKWAPGGPASIAADEFMARLKNADRLPGWRKSEHGTVTFNALDAGAPVYPITRTFDCRKNGDPTTYHYTVAQASSQAPWIMRRAWHTNAKGRLMAELATP